ILARSDVAAVMIRKDPPFDQEYLHLTRILELVRDRTLVCNDPRGLRDANVKLCSLHFAEWMPQTMVSRERGEIRGFVSDVDGEALCKAHDGAGGSGVVAMRRDDETARALAEMLTREGKAQAVVQAYLHGVVQGAKRARVLDGQVLGAI